MRHRCVRSHASCNLELFTHHSFRGDADAGCLFLAARIIGSIPKVSAKKKRSTEHHPAASAECSMLPARRESTEFVPLSSRLGAVTVSSVFQLPIWREGASAREKVRLEQVGESETAPKQRVRVRSHSIRFSLSAISNDLLVRKSAFPTFPSSFGAVSVLSPTRCRTVVTDGHTCGGVAPGFRARFWARGFRRGGHKLGGRRPLDVFCVLKFLD